ncbi:hypothetical protein A2U01_0119303 [Trifolium medium]|uniref:Uncharacterized protein n=1 Tax=Trifolium medium TaxID=97028 RepID=A0A392WKY5_9FABA|nr:hypothetical protein [Trifolium medium]
MVPARHAGVYGALRRSIRNSRIHLWHWRVAQPGLARRAVESSSEEEPLEVARRA